MAFRTPVIPKTWSLDKHGSQHRSAYCSKSPQKGFPHRYGVPTAHVFGCHEPVAETRSPDPSLQQMSISESAL
jgi:hypothetical protein